MGVQSTTLPYFFPSLLAFVGATGIFGASSVDYAIDAEAAAEGLFPSNPPPFCLIQPGRLIDSGKSLGGGRFTKTWIARWRLVIISRNITDVAYKSTAAVTSNSTTTGPYAIADQVINLIEQGYVTDGSAKLQFVNLPVSQVIDSPSRLKKSAEYIMLPIDFEGEICHNLPASLP